MKKATLLFLCLGSFVMSKAQCDYTNSSYAITEELNVVYGTAINFGGVLDTLKMNIYKPINSDVNRPVLMMIHGGGFSGGNKESFTTTCKNMAKKGFVTATISYRLGFYRPLIPNNYPYVLDPNEYRRAVHRAMQDGFGAIRFLKGRNAIDSSDTHNFFIGGGSAGAITAMQMAFAHHDSLKHPSNGKIGDAVVGLDRFSRPDLGSIYGNLNKNGQSNQVQGVLNIFGAIEDTTWVKDNKGPAIWSYHQTGDPVVPCARNKAYHGIGLGIPDNYGVIHGSCFLQALFERRGYDSMNNLAYLHNGNAHSIHNAVLVETEYTRFLNYQICKNRTMALKDLEIQRTTSIYPNPVQNELLIRPKQDGTIEIKDVHGRLVLHSEIYSGQNKMDVSHLLSGVYFVVLKQGGVIEYSKLVKE